jgi:hypothetical protein
VLSIPKAKIGNRGASCQPCNDYYFGSNKTHHMKQSPEKKSKKEAISPQIKMVIKKRGTNLFKAKE